jgi:hypothetical protein
LKRSPLRAGKKTIRWANIRAVLKQRFEQAGIITCELGFKGCWRDNALGFAHYDKRRFIAEEELWIVVLACNHCHDIVEQLPRAQMKHLLLSVIAGRKTQP